MHSFFQSRNNTEICVFCKADDRGKTDLDIVEELNKRVEANDACAMFVLGNHYFSGKGGLQQNREKANEVWKQAARLGSSLAHYHLGTEYDEWGDSKKAKFHYEAAAMAGHEQARYNLGYMKYNSRNIQRAIKHWIIGASAGDYDAMQALLAVLKQGLVSRDATDSTLAAYNNSSVEIRSESRDAFIRLLIDSRFHGVFI